MKSMAQEQWTRWEPIKDLSAKYHITLIKNSVDGLEFLLTEAYSQKNKVRMFFKNSAYAYRNTDESFWMRGIDMLDERYGTEFYAKWTFFKVTNSDYLAFLLLNVT